jgi:sulfur carrier protein
MISITVNGETRHDFAVALQRDALAGEIEPCKRVALERNGEIVPRGRLAEERLAEGDRLEIVVAVGGG